MGIASIALKAFSYGKRALKVAPEFLLGDSSELIGKAMRRQKGSIFTKVKAGAKALEKDVIKKSAQGGFAKRVVKNLLSTPKTITHYAKLGANVAKKAGKNTFIGGLKGVGKGIVKKMPFIGAALTVAMEAPNIYTAFRDGGVGAGMKEVGGATVELGCMAAGAAIGSAICPGVGTLIGGIIGGVAGCFLRGKTFTEKQEEQKAQKAQAKLPQYSKEDIARLKEYGFTDEEIEQLKQNGYTIEDIEKAIQEELKKEDPNKTVTPQDNTRVEKPEIPDRVPEKTKTENDTTPSVNPNQQTASNPYMSGTTNPFIGGTTTPFTTGMMYPSYMSGMTTPFAGGMMYPYMSGTTTPFMGGMMYPSYIGGTGNFYNYSNPYSNSLFQMNYSNPFMYNPQNQYFRYTG